MHFVSTTDWEEGVTALTKRLRRELKQGQVLWLVCGGSNIAAAVKIMDNINEKLSENLCIFLTDERFGEFGHNHSNAKQLREAGFDPKQALFMPVLQPGFSLEETQERYSAALHTAVGHASAVIAQFGIGADGHIAGILPHSPAATATDWVAAYEAPPYTRVTLTFPALSKVTAAYAMAFGADKHEALQKLQHQDLSLEEQPSQILKQLPDAFLYSDQLGDTT